MLFSVFFAIFPYFFRWLPPGRGIIVLFFGLFYYSSVFFRCPSPEIFLPTSLCTSTLYLLINHLVPFRTEFSFIPPPDFNAGISHLGGRNIFSSSTLFSTTTLPGYSISPASTTPTPSVAPNGRCSIAAPSGSLSEDENTIPDWIQPESSKLVFLRCSASGQLLKNCTFSNPPSIIFNTFRNYQSIYSLKLTNKRPISLF